MDKSNLIEIVEDELNYLFLVKPDKDGIIRYQVIASGSREENCIKTFPEWKEYISSLYYSYK